MKKENKPIIGIGIDRQNKTIEIFDKYAIEHTEVYLEIAKQLLNLLNPKELKEFEIVMEDCKFKNVEEWAEKNKKDLTKVLGVIEEEIETEDLNLTKRFTYTGVAENEEYRCQDISDLAKNLAKVIKQLCPAGREQSIALTKVEEAVMWANLGIAREE